MAPPPREKSKSKKDKKSNKEKPDVNPRLCNFNRNQKRAKYREAKALLRKNQNPQNQKNQKAPKSQQPPNLSRILALNPNLLQ